MYNVIVNAVTKYNSYQFICLKVSSRNVQNKVFSSEVLFLWYRAVLSLKSVYITSIYGTVLLRFSGSGILAGFTKCFLYWFERGSTLNVLYSIDDYAAQEWFNDSKSFILLPRSKNKVKTNSEHLTQSDNCVSLNPHTNKWRHIKPKNIKHRFESNEQNAF